MNERLAAADAALKERRGPDAIAHLIAACTENPAQSAQVYRVLCVQLYRLKRYEEAAEWAAKGLEQHPRDVELLNTRGVMFRNLKRYPEALEVLDEAAKINPANASVNVNRGNVLLDMGEPARAEAAFTKLVRQDPRNAEYQRQLGRSLARQGKRDAAAVRFRQAVNLNKQAVDAWLDLISLDNEAERNEQAEKLADRALAANPDHPRLLEAKVVVIRRSGDLKRAEALLTSLLERFPDAAWLHYQMGSTISDYDRPRGNQHLRRAIELDPDRGDALTTLIESLERTRTGDEAANIEEAYQLAQLALRKGDFSPSATKILNEVLIRVCAFDEIPQLGGFKKMGRAWAESSRHTALLKQLAFVRSHEDRLELLEQHRIWGRLVEAKAREHPIRQPGPRAPDGRIRLGFMSSDLRQHPVAYFALPLFDHVDRERFDVYCYSYSLYDEDPMQAFIAKQVKAFRWEPHISPRDAAQLIANDQLDMLIELGGSTHMNKLETMAYRPAPRQASWLGYPHSAGLSTIDYFVCDPYSAPPDRSLLIEQPLMMPHTWLALGRAVFSESRPLTEGLPETRNGFLTFGTANNPHKYGPEVLSLWARITAAVPNARFAFVRPEGGSPTFRKNILAYFTAQGVDESRVLFHVVRGQHMPFYNEIDITLDPFPLTGGTTTTEALWMGVPVVSLKGESFHERLSWSILSNAGLGDLVSSNLDDYFATALQLVADRPRREDLRRTLRERIKQSPLGQTEAFARDFYDMVAKAVAETPAAAVAAR